VDIGHSQHHLVYFEATPDYLFDPRVARRATGLVPEARIIVLLRDPIERAYSHYCHNRRLGTETLSFNEALSREEDRIRPAQAEIEANPDIPMPKALLRYSYVERGRYSDQLRRWISITNPAQMLVLRSESIFKDPDATFQSVLRFLDLREWRPTAYENHSYESSRPVTPPMPDTCRERLMELLSEDMLQLPEVLEPLGVDLPDWLSRKT
jgi:hypothetical protein